MPRHTSFELSKKLWENGCRLEYKKGYMHGIRKGDWFLAHYFDFELNMKNIDIKYPAYDILWDICIRYKKEFFGEKIIDFGFARIPIYSVTTQEIVRLLQENKSQEEIEDYIWKNCKFNPENIREENK